MNTIKYNDILKTYQRIDLYRAKYRHNDFTLHAWCFHGNKQQDWTGYCQGGFLRSNNGFVYNAPIEIDASTYKYLSFKFMTPGVTPKLGRYKLIVTYTTTEQYTKEIVIPYSGQLTTVFYDLASNDANWTGTVSRIGFTLSVESSEGVWSPVTTEVQCEYIKFDQENVFASVLDANTITIVDFNEMRGDIETFAKQSISWENHNRVRQFIDTIRKSDIDEVNQKITVLAPYNGCATCDNFECICDSTDYGHIPCQACNACNQHMACNTCDKTCHEQARSCSCDTRCYGQATGCSCDSRCNGYSSCSCDSSCNSCYSGNKTCSQCNTSKYSETTVCPCNTGCYSHECRYEHTDTQAHCSWCYVGCDVATEYEGCRTDGQGSGGGCICNAACYHQCGTVSGTQPCPPACYVERCYPHGGDHSQDYTTCTVCNSQCYNQQSSCSSCYTGYGRSGCSSCNNQCYGQATPCSCDQKCYTEARGCTCDQRCNLFQACQTCDGCDTYLACSCDNTCYTESCEQCHKSGYSSVPI